MIEQLESMLKSATESAAQAEYDFEQTKARMYQLRGMVAALTEAVKIAKAETTTPPTPE